MDGMKVAAAWLGKEDMRREMGGRRREGEGKGLIEQVQQPLIRILPN